MTKKIIYLRLEIPQKIVSSLGQGNTYARELAAFLNAG